MNLTQDNKRSSPTTHFQHEFLLNNDPSVVNVTDDAAAHLLKEAKARPPGNHFPCSIKQPQNQRAKLRIQGTQDLYLEHRAKMNNTDVRSCDYHMLTSCNSSWVYWGNLKTDKWRSNTRRSPARSTSSCMPLSESLEIGQQSKAISVTPATA